MNAYPPEFQFRLTWRSYQKRVLEELESHLDDNTLHVIAPPGSGKTVLGIEVLRQLNQPTLILSPTITIRDQWIDRLVHLFLPEREQNPSWISTNIKKPRFLTSTTYQAMHTVCRDKLPCRSDNDAKVKLKTRKKRSPGKAFAALVKSLRQLGVKTIVLDEAHHLKNEWWKSLVKIIRKLDDPIVVAVTATPPYDVSYREWQRYTEICGPVDAEISIPELVWEGDLCPHQDYVCFSTPLKGETRRFHDFRQELDQFKQDYLLREELVNSLANHPFLNDPDRHVEPILDNTAFFSSIAIYLKFLNRPVPVGFLELIGGSLDELPPLNDVWLETFLTGLLFNNHTDHTNHTGTDSIEKMLPEMRRELKKIGAVHRNKVFLLRNPKIKKELETSAGKLISITQIVASELANQKDALRMLILTDYIRKAEMPADKDDIKPLALIGVVPIFEALRRKMASSCKLGILTGSLVVIPHAAQNALTLLASQTINNALVKFTPLKADPDYLAVTLSGGVNNRLVALITKLLAQGVINVLVGTKALLGEGWDAPSVNALILASVVGSYVSSNQMRGRAIRSDPSALSKTANIWHLICEETDQSEYGDDFNTMRRRLKTFVGLSFTDTVIENGLQRLDLGSPPYSEQDIERLNTRSFEMADNRDEMAAKWKLTLANSGTAFRLVDEIRVPSASVGYLKDFLFANTKKELFKQGLWGVVTALAVFISASFFTGLPVIWKIMILALAAGPLLASLRNAPKCVKAIKLWRNHGSTANSLRQMGLAVVYALIHTGAIKTPPAKIQVITDERPEGGVRCTLAGGDGYERSLFLGAMREIIEPVANPKYLLISESAWHGSFYDKFTQHQKASDKRFKEKVRKRMLPANKKAPPQLKSTSYNWLTALHVDFHAVPKLLGQRKEQALYFEKMWQHYTGDGRLIYTRTSEGRQVLLKARLHSLSAAFLNKSEIVSRWR